MDWWFPTHAMTMERGQMRQQRTLGTGWWLAGFGLGAGTMYLLDPAGGGARCSGIN